ncbi:hypothetical protein DL96DRAFT_1506787 [Flagelloscypha sp. PMI_526]|nr:hypothetical protein DL96DRAFT_1506787 [Flagelloscypha sp. PMI_526]
MVDLVRLAQGPPSPTLLFTPFLIGTFLSTILYGAICTQVITYFQIYGRRDVWWLRCLVAYLFLAETVMTISELAICYEPFVLKSGKPEAMSLTPKMLPADSIVTVLISTPVQIYLAWRLKLVTESNVLAIIIVLLSLGSLTGGLLTGINVIATPEFRALSSFSYWPTTWLICSSVADVLISAGLVWFLAKNKAGFSKTKSLVDKIIMSTVQSGIITSFVAILTLVLFLAIPGTTLMFVFDFSLSKLYASSLFSTLIARKRWNDLINTPLNTTSGTHSSGPISLTNIEHGFSHVHPSSHSRRNSRSHNPHVQITTHVERSTSQMDDFLSPKKDWSGPPSPSKTSFSTLSVGQPQYPPHHPHMATAHTANHPVIPIPLTTQDGRFLGFQQNSSDRF